MNKQNIYRQIEREYENDRNKNSLLLEKRREQIYARLPIVKEIDTQLKAQGVSLMRLAMRHAGSNEVDAVNAKITLLNKQKDAALASIGLSQEYLQPVYTCPECKDTGYIGSTKCACMKKKLVEKYYAVSNLSNILEFENFDKFDLSFYDKTPFPDEELSPFENMRLILEDVLTNADFAENDFFNYYFYGNSGLGKTFMCSCIAKKLLDEGNSVIYMSAYSLADLLEKNRFRHDELEEDDESIDMLFDADLLIIDDLGTESPTSVTASEIFKVINNRLINRKSTVISSNLSPRELSGAYSDRVVSRIVGHYTVHHFYGDDIRMK